MENCFVKKDLDCLRKGVPGGINCIAETPYDTKLFHNDTIWMAWAAHYFLWNETWIIFAECGKFIQPSVIKG